MMSVPPARALPDSAECTGSDHDVSPRGRSWAAWTKIATLCVFSMSTTILGVSCAAQVEDTQEADEADTTLAAPADRDVDRHRDGEYGRCIKKCNEGLHHCMRGPHNPDIARAD